MVKSGSQRKYILILAVVALVILITGSILRPKVPEPKQKIDLELGALRTEMQEMQQSMQRNNARTLGQRFASVANTVAPSVLWLDQLARSAVRWNSTGLVVTSGAVAPRPQSVTTSTEAEQNVSAVPAVWSPTIPFAALSAKAARAPARVALSDISAGDWLIAVARRSPRVWTFTPLMFTAVTHTECAGVPLEEVALSAALSPDYVGGGVFDLSGRLAASITRCGSRMVAVPGEELDRLLRRAQTPAATLAEGWGFQVADQPQPVRVAGATRSGLLVTTTWRDWPADNAGLVAGDVILGAGSESNARKPVSNAAELSAALDPAAPAVTVERRGRERVIALNRVQQHADSGVILQHATIAQVVPGSAAARNGLIAGDAILSIDNRPVRDETDAQARLASATQPVLTVIQRENVVHALWYRP